MFLFSFVRNLAQLKKLGWEAQVLPDGKIRLKHPEEKEFKYSPVGAVSRHRAGNLCPTDDYWCSIHILRFAYMTRHYVLDAGELSLVKMSQGPMLMAMKNERNVRKQFLKTLNLQEAT